MIFLTEFFSEIDFFYRRLLVMHGYGHPRKLLARFKMMNCPCIVNFLVGAFWRREGVLKEGGRLIEEIHVQYILLRI